jgi:hypothetical protein
MLAAGAVQLECATCRLFQIVPDTACMLQYAAVHPAAYSTAAQALHGPQQLAVSRMPSETYRMFWKHMFQYHCCGVSVPADAKQPAETALVHFHA